MDQATTGVQFNKEEQDMFDTWSKEAIYEAYLIEQKTRYRLNVEVNRLGRRLAEIKYMASNEDRAE